MGQAASDTHMGQNILAVAVAETSWLYVARPYKTATTWMSFTKQYSTVVIELPSQKVVPWLVLGSSRNTNTFFP